MYDSDDGNKTEAGTEIKKGMWVRDVLDGEKAC